MLSLFALLSASSGLRVAIVIDLLPDSSGFLLASLNFSACSCGFVALVVAVLCCVVLAAFGGVVVV